MTRLTDSVLARLRALPARTRNALLAALGYVRPVRPPPVTPPPPPTGDWPKTTQGWSSDWDLYRLDADKGATATDFLATGPKSGMGQMVLLADMGKVHQGYAIIDCLVQIATGAFRQWGCRAYDVVDWSVRRSRFAGPGQEHGLYLNAPGGLLIEDCRFDLWGGAGVQVAFRKVAGVYANESTDPMLAAQPSKHVYRRVTIENCGDPESDRFGAFLISEHAAEIDWEGYVSHRINADVLIEDCLLRGGNLNMDYKGKLIRSTRGILVQERPSATIRRTRVEMPAPMEDWAAQIWGVDHVLIEDSHFEDGVVEIRNAKSVTVRNCTGNAVLRVGTGPWNVFPMPNVTHLGPIGAGYVSPVVAN